MHTQVVIVGAGPWFGRLFLDLRCAYMVPATAPRP
jgi:hypothetical protein